MPQSNSDAKESLERLIFVDEKPQEWVQDVWEMSPTLAKRQLDCQKYLMH